MTAKCIHVQKCGSGMSFGPNKSENNKMCLLRQLSKHKSRLNAFENEQYTQCIPPKTKAYTYTLFRRTS